VADIDEREFFELLRRHRTFVLTTHVNPDGDALGSEIALARLIPEVSGPDAEVRIVNRDGVPELLSFLDPTHSIEVFGKERHAGPIRDADVVICLDNSDTGRLGEVHDAIRASSAIKACVDHHPDPDPFWDLLFVDEGVSCTAEIVHDLFRSRGVEPGREAAIAMYIALVSDTGRFRFANTGDRAFEMAAELVRSGASPAEAYSQLEERLSEDHLSFLGHVLAGAELRAEGRIMILRAPQALLSRHRMAGVDLGELINLALRSETARVTALFREVGPSQTKVSLRSKGRLDVNRLAREHGGGGHRNASGILLDVALEDAIERVSPDLEKLVG